MQLFERSERPKEVPLGHFAFLDAATEKRRKEIQLLTRAFLHTFFAEKKV